MVSTLSNCKKKKKVLPTKILQKEKRMKSKFIIHCVDILKKKNLNI